jgi:hypothetical protein
VPRKSESFERCLESAGKEGGRLPSSLLLRFRILDLYFLLLQKADGGGVEGHSTPIMNSEETQSFIDVASSGMDLEVDMVTHFYCAKDGGWLRCVRLCFRASAIS